MTKNPKPKFSAGVAAEQNWFRGVAQDDLFEMGRWDLFSLAIAGPKLGDEKCRALDRLAAALCVADPRIWPLTISRIAANYAEPSIAMGLTIASMSDSPVGPAEFEKAAQFLLDFDGTLKGHAPGFLVIGRPNDERVNMVETISADHREKHWETYEEVKGLSDKPPHVSLAAGALLLDFGFSPRQIFFVISDIYMIPIYANVMDGLERGFHPTLDDLCEE